MADSSREVPDVPLGRAYDLLLALVLSVLVLVAGELLSFKLRHQPPLIDFLTMWTGGAIANADPRSLYDFARIDDAQAWLLGARAHDRPFPYPPSALLVFAPLARLPFWISERSGRWSVWPHTAARA